MWKRSLLAGVLLCLLGWQAVWAHAVLDHSKPEANAVLDASPAEIRLWMTEPVEPQYSTLQLRNSAGGMVAVPPAAFDAADPNQMYVAPVQLDPGLYTVVWTTVSAADGHRSQGSFPFMVAAATQPAAGTQHSAVSPGIDVSPNAGTAAAEPVKEVLPPADVAVRWFNFLALVWGVGSIAFVVLVWRPIGHELGSAPTCERRLWQVISIGWLLMGAAMLLVLLLQAELATGGSLLAPTTLASLDDVLAHTRFGGLWLARLGFWILLGVLLVVSWRWARNRVRYGAWALWAALAAAAVLMGFTSLFSHAQAASEPVAATAADWLHLLMTAVWLGGLIQLAAVLPVLGRELQGVGAVDRLIAQFSNVARVAVVIIILTGLYAAWLQVGSLAALVTTLYGQLLLVKLVLIIPLIGIAAFNLIVTRRGLRAGGAIWTVRLRWLVGIELALALLVLLAVAGMTAIAPAHSVVAQRQSAAPAAASAAAPAAAPAQSAPLAALPSTVQPSSPAASPATSPAASSAVFPTQPVIVMQTVDDLHVMLTISPGWVGENEFVVDLSTPTGDLVTDASLIRLRFDHQDLGQSELRIEPGANPDQQEGNLYHITGANLSVPGDWRIRVTVARPDQYDTVIDFNPTIPPPP